MADNTQDPLKKVIEASANEGMFEAKQPKIVVPDIGFTPKEALTPQEYETFNKERIEGKITSPTLVHMQAIKEKGARMKALSEAMNQGAIRHDAYINDKLRQQAINYLSSNSDELTKVADTPTPTEYLKGVSQWGEVDKKKRIESYINNYISTNKPTLVKSLEDRKDANLEKLATTMSDADFVKRYDINGVLQKMASNTDNPAKFLRGEQDYGSEVASNTNNPAKFLRGEQDYGSQDYGSEVALDVSPFFKPNLKRDDIINPDGSVNRDFKKKVMMGAMNNPFDLYNAKQPENGVHEQDIKNGTALAHTIGEQTVEENKNAHSVWNNLMQDVNNSTAINDDDNLLTKAGKIGGKEFLNYNEHFIKGAADIGALGASILEIPFTGVSGVGQNLGEKTQQINELVNTNLPQYNNSIGNAASGIVSMVAEFEAGGGLNKIGASLLTKPLAQKGVAKILSKVEANAGVNSKANQLLARTLNILQSAPATEATKFVDRFGSMLTTGGAQMYADAYDNALKQGYKPQEAVQKAKTNTLIQAMFFSSLGSLLKFASPEEKALLQDVFKEGKLPEHIEGKGIGNYIKKNWSVIKPFIKPLGVNTSKGVVEFSGYNMASNYLQQREEFDKKKEQGLLPPNAQFKIDFNKIRESGGEGVVGGILMGVAGVLQGHGKPIKDPQAQFIASAMEDPEMANLEIDRAIRRGTITKEQHSAIRNVIAATKPYFEANKKQIKNLNPIENIKISLEQAKLKKYDIIRQDLIKNGGAETEIEKAEQLIDKSHDNIKKILNGTYLQGSISAREMNELAKGVTKEQKEKLFANAPYKTMEVPISSLMNQDIENYINVANNSDIANDYLKQKSEIETELDKYARKQKLGIKLSDMDEAEKLSLEQALKDLKKNHKKIADHTDILGFEDTEGLAPVVDKDGNVIDGNKRIAKAILDGKKTIEVATPIDDKELNKLHEDAQDNNTDTPKLPDNEKEANIVLTARDIYNNRGIKSASKFIKDSTKSQEDHNRLLMATDGSITEAIADAAYNDKVDTEAPLADAEDRVETPPITTENETIDVTLPQEPTESQDVTLQKDGGDVETKQQIETFGVKKEDVEPVHSVISQVFSGLKKAGLTAAKTVGDWVGIGKGGVEKPYSLKINGKDVQVKNVQPEVVNGFYSPLEKVITDSKFDKLPAKQWLDKFGKSEEAKWTGLKDWLQKQEDFGNAMQGKFVIKELRNGKFDVKWKEEGGSSLGWFETEKQAKDFATGSVSKADIQKYLKDNRIEVVEVVKGGEKYDDKLASLYKKYDVDSMSRLMNVASKEDIAELDSLYEGENNQTKFSQYQLEGEKENYKEVLVTMPFNNESTFQGLADKYNTQWSKISKAARLGDTETLKEIGLNDSEIKSISKNNIEQFKSSHFDEPNILVHLRMNTRVDAEGNKVLFLEEIQSDWGQKGKKEGFDDPMENIKYEAAKRFYYEIWKPNKRGELSGKEANEKFEKLSKETGISKEDIQDTGAKYGDFTQTPKSFTGTPNAPFVTDTNAWTKLGLKIALKEAVKQGADKIAWTTGEQQNDRYDLRKQVDSINYLKNEDGTYLVYGKEGGNIVFKEKALAENKLEGSFGKDVAEKIINDKGNSKEGLATKVLEGDDLAVGGKGMKGFYGSPTEGSLGIVGNVAKSLFKQEPKTTKFDLGAEQDNWVVKEDPEMRGEWLVYDNKNKKIIQRFFNKNDALNFGQDKNITTTQHSIDITPELKASVEGGQPLFKDAEAQYRIESGKNIVEAIKDFNGSPRATVALTHEIMHPTVVAIIDGAKEGNEVGAKHTETIVNEFNKATGQKITVEDLIKGNDAFKDGTTSKQYRAVQEFIAKSWEKYHREGGKGFSESFQKVLDQITKAFQSVYKSISGKDITPELRKMFDELLGKEQSLPTQEVNQLDNNLNQTDNAIQKPSAESLHGSAQTPTTSEGGEPERVGTGEQGEEITSTSDTQNEVGDTHSAQNAVINAKREEIGLDPIMQRISSTDKELVQQANEFYANNDIDNVVASAIKNNRYTFTDAEQLAISYRRDKIYSESVRLADQVNEARESGDYQNLEKLQEQRATNDLLLDSYDQVLRDIGTTSAKVMRARRLFIDRQLTSANIIKWMKGQSMDGAIPRELQQLVDKTVEERDALVKKQEETQAQLDEALATIKKQQEQQIVAAHANNVVRGGGRTGRKTQRKELADATIDDAFNAFKKWLPKVSLGDDAQVYKNGIPTEKVIDYMAKAVKQITAAGIEVSEAIKRVREHVSKFFNIDNIKDEDVVGIYEDKYKNAKPIDKNGTFESLAKDLGNKFQTLDRKMLSKLDKMFEFKVAEALESMPDNIPLQDRIDSIDYNEITQEIYTELSKHIQDLDLEKLRDLISGYGEFRKLSPDELKRAASELKRNMVADAKVEATERGELPLRNGFERAQTSAKIRAKNAQIARNIKEQGIKAELTEADKQRAYKSEQDAYERRLDNEIKDIFKELEDEKRKAKSAKPEKKEYHDKVIKELEFTLEHFKAIRELKLPKETRTEGERKIESLRAQIDKILFGTDAEPRKSPEYSEEEIKQIKDLTEELYRTKQDKGLVRSNFKPRTQEEKNFKAEQVKLEKLQQRLDDVINGKVNNPKEVLDSEEAKAIKKQIKDILDSRKEKLTEGEKRINALQKTLDDLLAKTPKEENVNAEYSDAEKAKIKELQDQIFEQKEFNGLISGKQDPQEKALEERIDRIKESIKAVNERIEKLKAEGVKETENITIKKVGGKKIFGIGSEKTNKQLIDDEIERLEDMKKGLELDVDALIPDNIKDIAELNKLKEAREKTLNDLNEKIEAIKKDPTLLDAKRIIDFEPRTSDKKVQELKADIDKRDREIKKRQRVIQDLKEEWRLKNRDRYQIVGDFLNEMARDSAISSPLAVVKIFESGLISQFIRPFENAIGVAAINLMPDNVRQQAMFEGKLDLTGAEWKSFLTLFSGETWKEAAHKFKTGEHREDTLFADKRFREAKFNLGKSKVVDTVLDKIFPNKATKKSVKELLNKDIHPFFSGKFHMLAKTPAYKMAYTRNLIYGVKWAEKYHPEYFDITGELTPEASEFMQKLAYIHAKGDVYMDDSWVAKQVRGLIDKAAKEKGYAAGWVGNNLFKVLNVSSNYFAMGLDYIPLVGTARALYSAKRPLEMTPRRANEIARMNKRSVAGLVMFGLGMAFPNIFGGYGDYDKKNKQGVGSGEVDILGWELPHFMTHLAFLIPFQLGATLRRYLDTADEDRNALKTFGDAVKGVVETNPFAYTMQLLGNAFKDKKTATKVGYEETSQFIPYKGLTRYVSGLVDKDEEMVNALQGKSERAPQDLTDLFQYDYFSRRFVPTKSEVKNEKAIEKIETHKTPEQKKEEKAKHKKTEYEHKKEELDAIQKFINSDKEFGTTGDKDGDDKRVLKTKQEKLSRIEYLKSYLINHKADSK